jgi:hypothetical protein
MSEQEKQELAKAIVELIRTDSQIQSAVINLVCSCPNIMLEY